MTSTPAWIANRPRNWRAVPFRYLYRRTKRVGYENETLLSVYRDHGVVDKSSRSDNFNNASEDLGLYQLVDVGDLAINKMKAWQGSVAVSPLRGIVSPAYFVYTPTHHEHSGYLHYLFRSAEYTRLYQLYSKGIRVNQWDLDPSVHGSMPVLLPPVEDQRRIAEFLDRETAQIDELIAKQEQLLTTLAEREVALITTVVGRRGPAGTHPRVGSLRRFLKSITDGAHISPETEGGLHDFVSTRDISNGEIDFEGSLKTSPETYEYMVRTGCRPRPGDILFSKDGTVGKTAVVPFGRDFVVASSLVILQPDRSAVESRFLDYVLRSHGVQAQVGLFVKGAGLPRISVANVGRLVVEVPDLGSQLLAVRVLDDSLESLRHLVMRAETAIDLLRERRQALISAAVTGQIDVGGASK